MHKQSCGLIQMLVEAWQVKSKRTAGHFSQTLAPVPAIVQVPAGHTLQICATEENAIERIPEHEQAYGLALCIIICAALAFVAVRETCAVGPRTCTTWQTHKQTHNESECGTE